MCIIVADCGKVFTSDALPETTYVGTRLGTDTTMYLFMHLQSTQATPLGDLTHDLLSGDGDVTIPPTKEQKKSKRIPQWSPRGPGFDPQAGQLSPSFMEFKCSNFFIVAGFASWHKVLLS